MAAARTETQHGINHTRATLVCSSFPSVTTFAGYDVVGEIGEGGMGRVFKAMDCHLGRFVAVKVLRSSDPFECSRFRREAEVIALLDHPNIIKIYAIETGADGRPYLILEYAEGGSLDGELGGQPQEPRRAAEMVEILARAMQFAHEKGVIHRDLKPANVLRCKDGVLKLTDFGLARDLEVSSGLTPTGAVMGTPSYMAPEQASGRTSELGPATDVYSLGAILYEMLTGRPPFRGVNMIDTLEQVRWVDPVPLSRLVPRVHRDLAIICLKCLQKSPGRRYATAGELADDLRRWMNGESILARPAPSWERAWRQICRCPWQSATMVAMAMLAVLLVIGWMMYVRNDAERRLQDERAQAERMLYNTQKQADEERLATQEKNNQAIRARSEQALRALEGIRDMMLEGKLRDVAELEPLKDELFVYYRELNDQLKNDPLHDKARLAESWAKIGDLILETGRREQAMEAFASAEELYARAAQPERYHLERAQVLAKLGRAAFEQNRDVEAKSACDRAAALLILGSHESQDRAVGCEADIWHLRGELASRERKLPDAILAYERVIALRGRMAGEYRDASDARLAEMGRLPLARRHAIVEHLRGLARGYGYLGDAHLDNRDLDKADSAYWQSLRIREGVVRAVSHLHTLPAAVPGHNDRDRLTTKDLLEAKLQLARGWANFAAAQRWCRATGTARHFAEIALKIKQEVSRESPNNVLFRNDLCDNINLVVELKLLLGERTDIETMLLDSRKVPDDGSARSKSAAAVSHLLMAQYLIAEPGRREDARKEVRIALNAFDSLCDKDPSNPVYAFYRAAGYALAGELGEVQVATAQTVTVESLMVAARKRFRDVHPEDVPKLRAFEFLRDDPGFREALKQLDNPTHKAEDF